MYGRNSSNNTSNAVRNCGICFPLRYLTFPSYSHTATSAPSGYSKYVNDNTAMIVHNSLAYERRKNVAKIATGFLPSILATVPQ